MSLSEGRGLFSVVGLSDMTKGRRHLIPNRLPTPSLSDPGDLQTGEDSDQRHYYFHSRGGLTKLEGLFNTALLFRPRAATTSTKGSMATVG